MIGNDIIDWQVVLQSPKADSARFVQKVLSSSEQIALKKAVHPERFLWACWALKEAAYKAWFKKKHQRFFAPKKFECIFDSNMLSTTAVVFTPYGYCYGQIKHLPAFIHATVSIKKDVLQQIFTHELKFSEDSTSTQSSEIRNLLKKYIYLTHGYIPEYIELINTNGFISVKWKNISNPVTVSISHHGHWGGIAFG